MQSTTAIGGSPSDSKRGFCYDSSSGYLLHNFSLSILDPEMAKEYNRLCRERFMTFYWPAVATCTVSIIGNLLNYRAGAVQSEPQLAIVLFLVLNIILWTLAKLIRPLQRVAPVVIPVTYSVVTGIYVNLAVRDQLPYLRTDMDALYFFNFQTVLAFIVVNILCFQHYFYCVFLSGPVMLVQEYLTLRLLVEDTQARNLQF